MKAALSSEQVHYMQLKHLHEQTALLRVIAKSVSLSDFDKLYKESKEDVFHLFEDDMKLFQV